MKKLLIVTFFLFYHCCIQASNSCLGQDQTYYEEISYEYWDKKLIEDLAESFGIYERWPKERVVWISKNKCCLVIACYLDANSCEEKYWGIGFQDNESVAMSMPPERKYFCQ